MIAVGFGQDLLHDGVGVRHRLAAVLAVDVGVHHAAVERAGPVQGRAGDDVADVVRPQPLEQLADAVRLELEHALGVAALQQRVRLRVVQRQLVDVDRLAARLLDQLDRVVQQRQGAQAQEVHLEHADLFQVAHDPLRRHDGLAGPRAGVVALAHHALQRHVVRQRPVGDHHAGRVRAGVAVRPLQPAGHVDQLAHLRVGLVGFSEFRTLFQRLVQRDPQRLGDHVGQLRDALQREVEDAADVLDGGAGGQRAERGDLGHAALAVLLADVGDDLLAALLAEVDVDVRRLGAVGVEEALEQQVVLQRIDVAELEDVADHGAARRAAGAGRDLVLHGETHEIADDEEVAGEAHPADDVQLVLQPVENGLRRLLAVAVAQAGLAQLAEVVFRRLAVRRREDGEVARLEVEVDVNAVRDLLTPLNRFLAAGEEAVHLLRRPDVELIDERVRARFAVAHALVVAALGVRC